METALAALANSLSAMPEVQYEAISEALAEVAKRAEETTDSAKVLAEKSAEKSAESAESAEKSAESAEKSAESFTDELSKRQKQILEYMKTGVLYSAEEIATAIELKGSRTRQLLNELVAMGVVECTAATKNRRYAHKQT